MSGKKKERTFETGLRELEDVLEAIESGDLELETALARYERGVALLRELNGLLDGAEEKVRVLTRDLGDEEDLDLPEEDGR
jgi:exodeoxyribonuclease VII small subunit